MKIRNGFVSNSSSSSFIVKEKEFDKIECPNCKRLLSILLPKQKAQDFVDEHWCYDWNNNAFDLRANEIIYANHIPYHTPTHKILDKVLSNLSIIYIKENE